MKKHQKTAAELLAELNSDPAFVARQREREDQRLRDVEGMRSIAAPVIAELAALGFEVASIDELRQSGVNYAGAVPVLLKWLRVISDPVSRRRWSGRSRCRSREALLPCSSPNLNVPPRIRMR